MEEPATQGHGGCVEHTVWNLPSFLRDGERLTDNSKPRRFHISISHDQHKKGVCAECRVKTSTPPISA